MINNANVNINDKYGYTPLMRATLRKNKKIVKILLCNKANINQATPVSKCTPLMYAADHGYTKIVKILLKNNATITLVDRTGHTALSYAMINECTDIENLIRNYLYNMLLDTSLNVLPRDILREIINYL